MASKRPFSHVYTHPSRRGQVSQEPWRKKKKPDGLSGNMAFQKAHSTNHLKTQIRSLRRLLQHNDNLPPTIRIEKERALQSLQHELAQEQRAMKGSDIIGKWHKLRFFERQKATRRLKRARKELEVVDEDQTEEVRERLIEKVKDSEVELNYALYFPLHLDYVQLFPRKKRKVDEEEVKEEQDTPEAAEVERQGDAEMWEKVKQCMEEGTLDDLRNGKLSAPATDGEKMERTVIEQAMPKKKRREVETEHGIHGNRRERRRAAATKQLESDEESEGGFFE